MRIQVSVGPQCPLVTKWSCPYIDISVFVEYRYIIFDTLVCFLRAFGLLSIFLKGIDLCNIFSRKSYAIGATWGVGGDADSTFTEKGSETACASGDIVCMIYYYTQSRLFLCLEPREDPG
jgi:hypothetical protein